MSPEPVHKSVDRPDVPPEVGANHLGGYRRIRMELCVEPGAYWRNNREGRGGTRHRALGRGRSIVDNARGWGWSRAAGEGRGRC